MIRITVHGDEAIYRELERIAIELDYLLADTDPIQDIVADTITAQMDRQCDPDGNSWDPLHPAYQSWKQTVAPGAEIGRLYGTMKERDNLRGRASGDGHRLVISYGVDPIAIAHAVSFTLGGIVSGTSQPPRPFFGLNSLSEAELNRYFSTLITI